MKSAADISFFLWLCVIVFGLICVLAPILLKKRFARQIRKLEKLLALFSTPPQTVSTIKTAQYNVPQSSLAAQIIESWFPHDETELIEGAPAPICGRLSRSLNQITGSGTIALQIFYDITIPRLKIPINRRTGTLRLHLKEDSLHKLVAMEYEWEGAELAVSDLFSIDHKVLQYMIDRTVNEFSYRGYHEVTVQLDERKQLENRAKSLSGRQAKQWWRTYNPGEQAGRVYSFWPTPQDYAESVQNPQINFKDDGLKQCATVLNAIGIPKVTSGMFASVYHLKGTEEQWAVRCFDTRLIDQQERYKAISNFIFSDDLTYTVDFHYLEDGIKCGDTWFPILKMAWVEGVQLDTFVRDNRHNFQELQDLRWQFQIMMEKLRLNGVAHGDLQHGNILISGSEIYLVDYDGFYVPELEGRHSNELGHANYQHPTRTEKYFASYMDNFSAFVIDLALLCLMEDPTMWEKFEGGDECLLFRKSDYVHPESSKIIAYMKKHESGRLRAGVERLLSYLSPPLEEIPYLESDMPAAINVESLVLQDKASSC